MHSQAHGTQIIEIMMLKYSRERARAHIKPGEAPHMHMPMHMHMHMHGHITYGQIAVYLTVMQLTSAYS